MSAIFILIGQIVCAILLIAWSLVLAGRWLKYGRRGFGVGLLVAGLWMILAAVTICVSMYIADSSDNGAKLTLSLGAWAVNIALEVDILRRLCKTSVWRALAGWGVTWIPRVIVLVVMLFGVRGHLAEAFRGSAISMAPTLAGRHGLGVCPQCGGPVYFDMDEYTLQRLGMGRAVLELEGICMNCGATTKRKMADIKALPADRFFVTKFVTPRRWDLVTFHYQNIILVKRVVGMPGEEISIDTAGNFFVNGTRTDPPPDVPKGILRWPTMTGGVKVSEEMMKLKQGEKLRIGDDGYFVMGDNAERSMDSRTIGPVKRDDLEGVATWVYWPLSRMRVLR